MAYGRKYYCEFKNVQGDIHIIYISEKDYDGNTVSLRAETDQPFTTSYQTDTDYIFSSIRAKECTLKFTAENGISLVDFYSEDDEQFRIDQYVHSINGTVIDKLIASFFVVQDSCEQDLAAEPFMVTLKGTDNLALLKDVAFSTAGMPYDPGNGTNYYGTISLFDYFKIAINSTGLNELPLRIYSNIFENTNPDRTDSLTAEMFQDVFMQTTIYLDSEGQWKNVYDIIDGILKRFNCIFCQDNGAWNIIRRQESYLFTDNKIQGVEHNLITGDKTAVELNYNWPIASVPPGVDFVDKIFLDKADHISRIQRPFKYVEEDFNFSVIDNYINHADLSLPKDAVPYETNTVDGYRYDKYAMSYIPEWRTFGTETKYIEKVTEIATDKETDRYLVVPKEPDNKYGSVEFNPIQVTVGDYVHISLSEKTLDNTSDAISTWVRCVLISETGNLWVYVRESLTIESVTYTGVVWRGPFAVTDWDNPADVPGPLAPIPPYMYFATNLNGDNAWYILDQSDNNSESGNKNPTVPENGVILVSVWGTNVVTDSDLPGHSSKNIAIKGVTLTIKNIIYDSSYIVGQKHVNQSVFNPKSNYQTDIYMDDTPRNTIAGTLFTNALTNFGYSDTTTGANTNIGNIHFTRTLFWHRKDIIEARRLGDIITYERMHNAFKVRTIVDGTIYGLRYKNDADEWNFISLLCLLSLDIMPDLRFIFGTIEVDWMNATYKAVLNELYKIDDNSEPFDYTYLFQYLYATDK